MDLEMELERLVAEGEIDAYTIRPIGNSRVEILIDT
jgi:hypothetical protein